MAQEGLTIQIKGGQVRIDSDDLELVGQYRWHVSDQGYAVWRGVIDGNKQTIRMHRLITNAPTGKDVDHINRDRLDNRRSNLRVCDRKTNLRNGSRVVNQKGYWYDKSRVRGCWAVNGNERFPKRRRFNTEEEAKAYVQSIQ